MPIHTKPNVLCARVGEGMGYREESNDIPYRQEKVSPINIHP